jgi:hypothetical protein
MGWPRSRSSLPEVAKSRSATLEESTGFQYSCETELPEELLPVKSGAFFQRIDARLFLRRHEIVD